TADMPSRIPDQGLSPAAAIFQRPFATTRPAVVVPACSIVRAPFGTLSLPVEYSDCPTHNTDNKSFNYGCHFLTRDGTRRHLVPQTCVDRADAVPPCPTRGRRHAVMHGW